MSRRTQLLDILRDWAEREFDAKPFLFAGNEVVVLDDAGELKVGEMGGWHPMTSWLQPTQLDIEGPTYEGERKPRLLDMSTGNRVHTIKDRKDDLYETPAVAVRALLQIESVPLCIWEPCCGPGAIVRELRASGRVVVATDLIDYGCPDSTARRDFLLEREPPAGVPAIVMNPPFKLAEEFVAHAITLVPEVYVLLRVAFLEGLRWQEMGLRHHLARVHVFAPRLPMMHRAGWDGPVNSNSGMAFGWFSFQRDWARKSGRPTIDWFNWKRDLP